MSHPAPPPGNGFPGIDGLPQSTGGSPRNRLADALRRIGSVAVGHPLADDDVAKAADQLAQIADTLEHGAPPTKRPRAQPIPTAHPQDFFPSSPMIGFANPVAPPAEVWAVAGENGQREIRGRVTFDYPFEGPPTCVHGGIIAELFDELMGAANLIADQPGMTGTLTVRYRRPTPLLAPLDLVARYTGGERRKIFTWAGIYHEGELTAEAEGIFIKMDPDRLLDIATRNALAANEQVIDEDFAELIARREDS
jgi:acyl-coenzyme A thioesterase PaaI-like protein